MKIAFATMESFDNRAEGSVGSSMIRAKWLINHWPEAELYKIGEEYDVIIFQKVYWKEMMQEFPGIKILDLCDPDWLEGKPVMEYVDMADATVTSTQALADYIKRFRPEKKVICIPDRVDLYEYRPLKTEHAEVLKEVVWYGYHTGFKYVEQTLDILHNNNLNLTVISDQAMSVPMGYPGVQVTNLPYNQKTIMKDLAQFDAAILPDPSKMDLRGHFKSNNKVTQCWSLGLPVIRHPDDIKKLITKEQRTEESIKNLETVTREYDVRLSVQEMKQLIDEIKGQVTYQAETDEDFEEMKDNLTEMFGNEPGIEMELSYKDRVAVVKSNING